MGSRALISAIVIAIIASVVASCNSSGCTEGRSGIPQAEFYSSATGAKISLDSLRIYGVGAPEDTAMVRPAQTASSVYMPLEPDQSVTHWCIAYKSEQLDYPELIDTLTFEYSVSPYFVSEECGVGFRFDISSLTATDHLIDSVKLLDNLVTNVDKAYVAIYFRTE